MSLKELEKKILKEAQQETARTEAQAKEKLQNIERQHQAALQKIDQQAVHAANKRAEDLLKSIVVPARLAAKNRVLEEKQKIISKLYRDIKKDQDFREKTEIKVGKILFEE